MVVSGVNTRNPKFTATLQEPPKALQLQYQAGLVHRVPRRAYAVMEVPSELQVITAFVGLDGTPSVTSWESVRPPTSCKHRQHVQLPGPSPRHLQCTCYLLQLG